MFLKIFFGFFVLMVHMPMYFLNFVPHTQSFEVRIANNSISGLKVKAQIQCQYQHIKYISTIYDLKLFMKDENEIAQKKYSLLYLRYES